MPADTYLNAAAIGAIAGMRSLSAPAITSYRLRTGELDRSPLRFLSSHSFRPIAAAAAAGEMIADKLPWIPDRTSAGPLIGRAISGAVCGAAICKAAGKSTGTGALIGLTAAVGAAFAFFHLRKAASGYAPDTVLGLAEDALVLGIGAKLASNRSL